MSRSGRLHRASAAAPLGLGLLCLVVAFLQRPGRTFTDSRIELSTDPQGFLGDAASVWSSTLDLGHVQGGLFAGYLMPQGPWYALADIVGLPIWVAQRLLLALVLALAAWGAVRLMDALWSAERGPAHAMAGLLFALNPFVVVALAVRGTVWLLAYAALPWVLLSVKRGLGEPRRWRFPAAVGLAVALSGGAINAASIFWVAVAAIALAVYEIAVSGRSRGDLWRFGARAAGCVAIGCAWWVVPLAVQGAYGADFQQFAEQPGIIWTTTSLSESLRLLGFWVMYLGSGFGGLDPELGIGADYLFNAGVVLATFAIPLLAFGGLRWTRGWRYAPFLGLLAVGALLVMAVGFPPGTPLRRGVTVTSDNVRALEVLRTTYKAAPLLALAMACLGGVAVNELWCRVQGRSLPRIVAIAALAVALLASLPLLAGRALDTEVAYDEVPAYWRQAMAHAERVTPPDQRVMVMPGDQFAYYRWGFTTNSIAPTLTDRPVIVREVIRYADPRAAQLQDATDDLVQQGRALPGQLSPLLKLMGVGHVLLATDGDPRHSGGLPAGGLPAALAGQPELRRPDAVFGDVHSFGPLPGRSGEPAALSDISAHPTGGGPGIVRLHPRSGATVVDGDAQGVVSLAAHGALDLRRALVLGGDVNRSELRRLLAGGAELVFTDSGRRRVVSASRLRNSLGATLGPDDPIAPDSPTYDPFPGTEHETVARYRGMRTLRSLRLPYTRQFPEQRAFAALDGRLDTQWIQQGEPDDSDCCLHLAPTRPLAAEAFEVLPVADSEGRTDQLSVSENGGGERLVKLQPGWNRIELEDDELRTLRLQVEHVSRPGGDEGEGGLVEMRVPGLDVAESLRLPTGLASATRGLDLSAAPISVLLERTTADFPLRAGADVVAPQAEDPLDMVDAEPGLERDVTLPQAREMAIDGWATAAPAGNDARIDRLAGVPAGWRMEGSSRFEGVPGRRASSAFDRDRATAWVGDRVPGRRPWLSVRAPRPFAVRTLRLVPGPAQYRVPSRVRVRGEDGKSEQLAPDSGGHVTLSRAMRTRALRLEILQTRPPQRRPRTGALRGVAVAEVEVPGLRPPAPRRRGGFESACGALTVRAAGPEATAAVTGTLRALDEGRSLRLAGCGPRARVSFRAGETHLSAPPGGGFRPDRLRLRSRPSAEPAPAEAGQILDPGSGRNGRRDGVRLELSEPGWLVLGESYSSGWRAWCRDSSGGERDLGASEPIDGFANGWQVEPGCSEARFAFTPQRAATAGYGVSLLGALVLGTLLLAAALRRRRPGHTERALPLERPLIGRGSHERIQASWRWALAAGLAAAVVGGFVFALRAGVVIGPAVALVLGLGFTSRGLLRPATVALVFIPALYLVFPAEDLGGYSFDYAIDNLPAHWLAVAFVCCLAGVCVLELRSVLTSERAAATSDAG